MRTNDLSSTHFGTQFRALPSEEGEGNAEYKVGGTNSFGSKLALPR